MTVKEAKIKEYIEAELKMIKTCKEKNFMHLPKANLDGMEAAYKSILELFYKD